MHYIHVISYARKPSNNIIKNNDISTIWGGSSDVRRGYGKGIEEVNPLKLSAGIIVQGTDTFVHGNIILDFIF